uniref:V-type proton ATPase subunit a n=1 Tax=Ditylenchus dipsaci TaxID=166011 RepID=A0A915DEV4_9BILA
MESAIHRSEEMCLAQLFLQNEAAYACVAELGELGLVQFRDLNPDVSAFQRKYVKEVRRCDEMERKLRYLEREIKKDTIPMLDTGENPEAPQPREMYDLEATFEKLENELREVNQNEEMLKKNFAELTELKHILRKTQQFFEEVDQERRRFARSVSKDQPCPEDQINLLSEMAPARMRLGFVAGVIQRERLPAFERDQLKSRVKKICEGFRATLYPCPDTPQERREMSIGVMTRIEDLKTVLGQTQDHRHRVLVAAAKNVRMWMTKVRKIKAIYHTLNFFNLDVTQKCLIAECWCPVSDLDRIQMALKRGSDESGSTVPSILNRMDTNEQPPTYNHANKYTRGFQNIVDSYGIATYREINPAIYTIITFPFLFALMFGDLGHGIIMFLAALYLVLREKRLEAARITDEIFQMFFSGRYVIFLMGLFSIYTGLIYNDAFSKSFNLFGSSWGNTLTMADLTMKVKNNPEMILTLDPSEGYAGSPYPIGVDPVWNLAETNKLNFLNSMKMKASVLIGIAQMTFGVVLSYHNYKYFNSRLDILFTFLPQMIFLSVIFIYLCIEIVAKWIFFSAKGGEFVLGYYYPGSNCAPSLLIGLINMFMMKSRPSGFLNPNTKDGKPIPQCHLSLWYPGQSFFETLFIPTAVACVVVMLFGKPYKLWQENKLRKQAGQNHLGVTELVLILLAAISIPILLFAKPFFLHMNHKKEVQNHDRLRSLSRQSLISHNHTNGFVNGGGEYSVVGSGASDYFTSVRADVSEDDAEVIHHQNSHSKSGGGHGGHGDEPFDMGDIMVYQAIHTIEFALGCISHTASYLRLWALSLAHAQLSDVLWSMVFRNALNLDGYLGAILTYVIFFVFATLTLFILVLMEGLSAFLHALRLHWVEFQSKFYVGAGYAFAPFSFEAILEEARAAEEIQ